MANFIHSVQETCAKQPNKAAFVFLANGETLQTSLSYAALNQKALQVASFLQENSHLGDRILLSYMPGLEFITAFLGCLYAGRVAVPAHPLRNNHHANRLLAIVEDCQPSLILGTQQSLELMQDNPLFSSRSYVLTEELRCQNNHSTFSVKPNTLAFLQYTSGSTGSPKGVMVTHENIAANLAAIHYFYGLSPENKMISWLPVQHDMGLIGQVLYILHCATTEIVMAPAAFLEKPIRWLQAIQTYEGYAAGGPNFGYALCVERVTEEQLAELDLHTWQIAFNGAEPIRLQTLTAFSQKFKRCGFSLQKFLPCYGMAETTLLVSGKPSLDAPLITQERVSSGQIHESFTVKIVDPHTHTVKKATEVGEIWISGPSVAQGYWDKPALNASVFKAILANDKNTYLRTGDLGYVDGKGLYIAGRLKDLIILQGRNVYPQDIEAIVEASCEAVRGGCVAAFSVESNQQEAIVIAAEIKRTHRKINFMQSFANIRQALLQTQDVIPFAIVFLAPARALKTTSGKIQRQATKAAYLAGTLETLAIDTLSTEKMSDNYQKIAEDISDLVKKIFGIAILDPEKSFSHLGGTSIEALILQQQLQLYVGHAITLSPTLVFDHPNVHALATYLHENRQQKNAQNTASDMYQSAPAIHFPPLHKVSVQEWPLSLNETALFVVAQEKEGHTYLNMKMLASIEKNLEQLVFSQALNHIVQQHEILRTSFHQHESGKLYRIIHDTVSAALDFHDISKTSTERQEEDLNELRQELENIAFSLQHPPLFKFILIKINEDKFYLIFSMHHMLGDGATIGVLFSELMSTYQSLLDEKTVLASKPTITYADYAHWQQTLYNKGVFKEMLQYWEQQIMRAPKYLLLPYDKLKTNFTCDKANVLTLCLPKNKVQDLKEFTNEYKVSLYVLFMGALQLLLKQQTQQNEFLIETLLANRTDEQRQHMLGALAVDCVVLYQINSKLTMIEFLRTLLGQTLQLNFLLQDCGPLIYNSALKINPHLPTVGINFHTQHMSMLGGPIKIDTTFFTRHSLPGTLDLFLEVWPQEDSIVVDFVYRKAVFYQSTIECFKQEYIKILEFILNQPNGIIKNYKGFAA